MHVRGNMEGNCLEQVGSEGSASQFMYIYLSLHRIYYPVYINLYPYLVFMTHEVLPRVVDVASPNANRAVVGRLKWRLALLPTSWIVLSLVCIRVVVCIYISLWVDVFVVIGIM